MNVLFDLDGTLMDPKVGIIGCFKYALDALRIASPGDRELERFIGPPLRESFSMLLRTVNGGLVEQAVTLYRERFATVGMFENNLYSGIGDALAQLRDSGANLFVATSKPGVFAERIVQHFGLSQFFRAVYGSELDGSKAAKRDLIAHVLRAESLSPAETLMIGDRAHDVFGAKANGVFSVGVLWGYGSAEELATAGAGVLCEEPEMLVEAVSIVNAARVSN